MFEVPVPTEEMKYAELYKMHHPRQRSTKHTPANIQKRRKANKAAAKSRKGNR